MINGKRFVNNSKTFSSMRNRNSRKHAESLLTERLGTFNTRFPGVKIGSRTKIKTLVEIGEGTVIGNGVSIELNVNIGKNVIIEDGVTISRHCDIKDNAYVPRDLFINKKTTYFAEKQKALRVQKLFAKIDNIDSDGISEFAIRFGVDQRDMWEIRLDSLQGKKLGRVTYWLDIKNKFNEKRTMTGGIGRALVLMVDKKNRSGGAFADMVSNETDPTRSNNPISPEGIKIQKLEISTGDLIPVKLLKDSGKIPDSEYFLFLDSLSKIIAESR